MNARKFLASSLLVLAVACSGAKESDVLYDGTTTDGIAGTGDPSMTIEISGDALSVNGQSGTNAVFSLAVPDGAAAGSVGVRFKMRGSTNVRFSATSTAVTPVDRGGSCASNCYDNHGVSLGVQAEWQLVQLGWSQLAQEGWGTAAGLDPAAITHLNWHVLSSSAYNIWIDEVEFVKDLDDGTTQPITDPNGTGGGSTGTGGTIDIGSGGGTSTGGMVSGNGGSTNMSENRLGKYVDEIMFLQAFPGKSPAYKYSALLAAVDQFPEFASCCSEDQKKREIAAFMAHATHEADYLNATQEYDPPDNYCNGDPTYPCAGGKSYHGRGAMQISWNYNYKFAQDYFAANGKVYSPSLSDQPEQVATNEELLWTTALWFWMEGDPTYFNDSPHDRLQSSGFGSTTNKINGGLECGPSPSNPEGSNKRIQYFKEWCTRLGVDPGANLTC